MKLATNIGFIALLLFLGYVCKNFDAEYPVIGFEKIAGAAGFITCIAGILWLIWDSGPESVAVFRRKGDHHGC